MTQTVRLLAGMNSAGSPAFEEVPVKELGGSCYQLLRSPGLALGLAADDEFELHSDGSYTVLRRGGNVCIMVYCSADTPLVEDWISHRLPAISGRLDGKGPKVLVYTTHVDVGFSAIERVFKEMGERFSSAKWYFGNVYDPEDGVTPLNWW